MSTAQATIIPVLLYRNAPAAIVWLCEAFGFQRHLVVPSREPGKIDHAELKLGTAMIMLSSMRDDSEFAQRMGMPEEFGGRNTQSIYMVVPDCDTHYVTARKAGAEIIIDIKDESYGGRGYTCRDGEGHLWSFGTYDPWAN